MVYSLTQITAQEFNLTILQQHNSSEALAYCGHTSSMWVILQWEQEWLAGGSDSWACLPKAISYKPCLLQQRPLFLFILNTPFPPYFSRRRVVKKNPKKTHQNPHTPVVYRLKTQNEICLWKRTLYNESESNLHCISNSWPRSITFISCPGTPDFKELHLHLRKLPQSVNWIFLFFSQGSHALWHNVSLVWKFKWLHTSGNIKSQKSDFIFSKEDSSPLQCSR